MNDGELLSTLWVLLFAGHKTTAYLIGNAVYNLLNHRDQLRDVMADPELLPNAIEDHPLRGLGGERDVPSRARGHHHQGHRHPQGFARPGRRGLRQP